METIHTDNMREIEIKIHIPESLAEVNLASAMVFIKVMRVEGISDTEKAIQLIASMNDLDINDVRAIPLGQIHEIGSKLMNLFIESKEEPNLEDYLVFKIDGVEYGLEPNFDRIETGAYIDITDSILIDLDNKLHDLMATLYRPIVKRTDSGFLLTKYSTEPDEDFDARKSLFLKKMPYVVVRAVVNFMSSHIES